jgi:hypothetical protein
VSNRKTGIELYNDAQALMADCPTDAEAEDNPNAEEEWTERLLAWADASEQKAGAYRAVRAAAMARAADFTAMSKAFATYAKRESRVVDRIESVATLLLKAAEEATGAAELACGDGTKIRLARRRSKRVDVIDEAAVPDVWIRVKRSVDKAGAAKALKAGDEIPGLGLLESVSERVAWGL